MFDKEENFLNRELSWLKFNERVLNEANEGSTPLLERLKFIVITSSNLDEFFMIRVGGLKQQVENGSEKKDDTGLTAVEQLELIDERVRDLVRKQYRFLKKVMNCMEEEKIYLQKVTELSAVGRKWLDEYFYNHIYPALTTVTVDKNQAFPFLANRSLNLAVLVRIGTEESQIIIIPIPNVLPRVIEVPEQGTGTTFVLVEDVITSYCSYLFCGYLIKDVVPFRITRNADVLIDGEGAEDLLVEVKKSLYQRKRGEAVRLEIIASKKNVIRDFLIDVFKIDIQNVYEIKNLLDVSCLIKVVDFPGYEKLRYKQFSPQMPIELQSDKNLFDVIRDGDVLLHHPYESFLPVVDFIRQAANDPQVITIKQTLYRVSGNSSIVEALVKAAENGKEVLVVVEVRARFDEENNILWARRLEEAGCHVIYGLIGFKVHGKMALVDRLENGKISKYVHMGTGNYNDTTARIYCDMGLFTADEEIGADATEFFKMLVGSYEPTIWRKLVVAPTGLRTRLKELIDREIKFAEAGKDGHIIAKMNSLVDKEIILKLYEASYKGVKIELIVRGICSLIPGREGLSENITVRSIVGRFLEHHRIIYVANGGMDEIYLSSADWMKRNLSDRVELLFPINEEKKIIRIKNMLKIMLKDNCKAYIMKSDGNYRHSLHRGEEINSQKELCQEAESRAKKFTLNHNGI